MTKLSKPKKSRSIPGNSYELSDIYSIGDYSNQPLPSRYDSNNPLAYPSNNDDIEFNLSTKILCHAMAGMYNSENMKRFASCIMNLDENTFGGGDKDNKK